MTARLGLHGFHPAPDTAAADNTDKADREARHAAPDPGRGPQGSLPDLARGSGLIQALLLGLLLLFVFSLSQGIGERMSPQAAAAVFWLSSAFCQVLIFNQLYALEEANNARLGLLLCPAPIQASGWARRRRA